MSKNIISRTRNSGGKGKTTTRARRRRQRRNGPQNIIRIGARPRGQRAGPQRTFKRSIMDEDPFYTVLNSRVTRIVHSEPIFSWSDLNSSELTKTLMFPVSPVDLVPSENTSMVCEWLSVVSKAWDSFKFNRLTLRYMGTNTVIQSGSITWAVHSDPSDTPPQDPNEMLNLTKAGQSALRNSAWSVSIPLDSQWKKIADGRQELSTLRFYASNILYIRVDGYQPDAMPTGTFRIEYDISLRNPISYVDSADGFVSHDGDFATAHVDILQCIKSDTELIASKEFTENWKLGTTYVDSQSLGAFNTTHLECLKSGTYSIDFGRSYGTAVTDYGMDIAFDGSMFVDTNNYRTDNPTGEVDSFLSKCLNKVVWVCQKGAKLWARGAHLINQAKAIVGVVAPLIGAADIQSMKDPMWRVHNKACRIAIKRFKGLAYEGQGVHHPISLWKGMDNIPMFELNDNQTERRRAIADVRKKSPLRK